MNKKIDFRINIEKFIYFFVNKLVILTIIDKYIIPIWFENRNPVLILKLLILLSTHEVLVFLRTKVLNMKNMWMENETARDIKYRTINQGDMKPETAYKFIKRFTLTNTTIMTILFVIQCDSLWRAFIKKTAGVMSIFSSVCWLIGLSTPSVCNWNT